VITDCFIHSQGCQLRNWSTIIPEMSTSSFVISQTVLINALLDCGSFLLQAAINWSCSSRRTLAECYIVNYRLLRMELICSHPTACWVLLLVLPVFRTNFKCLYGVILMVATLAASWWTCWRLRCCCLPIIDVLDEAPANRLDLDPL